MSVISYNALRVDGLKEVLKDLSIVCKTLEIDFFIVGAVARNIWYASHGENAWGTKDIDSICKYYPQLESALIFDEYYELFDEDNEYQDIAMIVLGKEIDKIIKENVQLKKRIIVILDRAIDSKSAFLNHMIDDVYTETLEMKASILHNIKTGIMSK